MRLSEMAESLSVDVYYPLYRFVFLFFVFSPLFSSTDKRLIYSDQAEHN